MGSVLTGWDVVSGAVLVLWLFCSHGPGSGHHHCGVMVTVAIIVWVVTAPEQAWTVNEVKYDIRGEETYIAF